MPFQIPTPKRLTTRLATVSTRRDTPPISNRARSIRCSKVGGDAYSLLTRHPCVIDALLSCHSSASWRRCAVTCDPLRCVHKASANLKIYRLSAFAFHLIRILSCNLTTSSSVIPRAQMKQATRFSSLFHNINGSLPFLCRLVYSLGLLRQYLLSPCTSHVIPGSTYDLHDACAF